MRARVTTVIVAIFLSALSPFQPASRAAVAAGVGIAQSNLLMAFDLANPSGLSGNTLTDLSGNGYSGTIYQTSGQPSLNTSQGKYLSFSGNAGYVDIGKDIVSGSNWTGLSVSFYANMGTRSVVERIFDFGIGQANNNIWVGMGNVNRMAIEVFRDGGSPGWCESADNSVGANEWAHWTVVLNGSTCIWYKNNVLSRSVSYTYLPWARTLTTNYIGDSNWNVDPSFEGGIGELAIYKGALSDSERTQNYNAQTDITALVMSGSSTTVPENQSSAASFSSNKPNTTFSIIGGADSDKFDLSSSGALTFKTANRPNFEAPSDSGGNRIYDVTLRGVDANGNYGDISITITISDALESAALSVPVLSATPYKGISLTITVTPSGDGSSIPGKISYFVAGKRIAGCFKKSYTGSGSATCTWKPTTTGAREVSVTFTPNNTNFTTATNKKSFQIFKRTTTR